MQTQRSKDYSDDWFEFKAGLRNRKTLDLHSYLRNTVNCAARITGHDSAANALFEKLTRRAELIKKELEDREAMATHEPLNNDDRKRKLDDLYGFLGKREPGESDGARYDDPPIPTRPTPLAGSPSAIRPLVPTPRKRSPLSSSQIVGNVPPEAMERPPSAFQFNDNNFEEEALDQDTQPI